MIATLVRSSLPLQKAERWNPSWWRVVLMAGQAFAIKSEYPRFFNVGKTSSPRCVSILYIAFPLPKFDDRVNWEYVRILPDGETVSTDGVSCYCWMWYDVAMYSAFENGICRAHIFFLKRPQTADTSGT